MPVRKTKHLGPSGFQFGKPGGDKMGRFSAGPQVRHRFGVDHQLMRNKSVLETVIRGALAVATSVLTGAGAGALQARKPLLVPVQQRHQP